MQVEAPAELAGVEPVSRLDGVLLAFGKVMYLLALLSAGLATAMLIVVPFVFHESLLGPERGLQWALRCGAGLCFFASIGPLSGVVTRTSHALRRLVWRLWPRLAEGRHRESVRTCSIVAVAPLALALYTTACWGFYLLAIALEAGFRSFLGRV